MYMSVLIRKSGTTVEGYFYNVTGYEPWPAGQATIWGWIPISKIKELSGLDVYEIGTEENLQCVGLPNANPSENKSNTPSSTNYQTPAVKNPTSQQQTWMKYLKNTAPVKLTNTRFNLIKLPN